MASRAQPSLGRESVKAGAARSGALFAAIGIALVTLAIALALATYNAGDAALNTAAGGPTRNLLGVPGAWVSDLLLTIAGPLVAVVLPIGPIIARRRSEERRVGEGGVRTCRFRWAAGHKKKKT